MPIIIHWLILTTIILAIIAMRFLLNQIWTLMLQVEILTMVLLPILQQLLSCSPLKMQSSIKSMKVREGWLLLKQANFL
ncbi:hypothetical protein DSECCO2_250290 [anaerobic digester metagenome]